MTAWNETEKQAACQYKTDCANISDGETPTIREKRDIVRGWQYTWNLTAAYALNIISY